MIVGKRSEVIKLLDRYSWVVNMSVTGYQAMLHIKLPSLLQSLLCSRILVASFTKLSIQPADAASSPKGFVEFSRHERFRVCKRFFLSKTLRSAL
jgi:hypothetical protein